jgi:D-arabinose 1-dehydrogenase-like Zn-dependent alcohol dehydrogenase
MPSGLLLALVLMPSMVFVYVVLTTFYGPTRRLHNYLVYFARLLTANHTQTFPFDEANEALIALNNDSIRGAGVLVMD